MILTIGPGGCGFTFLNWSIAYLRGDNFYTCLDNTICPVTNDPILSNGTAHNQQKDHIQKTSDLIKLKQGTDQSIIYIVPTHQSDIEYILSFPGKKIIFNTTTHSSMLMARMCCVLKDSPYMEFINNLSTKYNKQIIKQVLIESNKFFTKYYTIEPTYQDYINIDYTDVFENLDQQIYRIFTYLELEIAPERLTKWLLVYQKYRLANKDWLTVFLGETLEIDNTTKTKILKELIQWKNG
jgi:hypothetical protein